MANKKIRCAHDTFWNKLRVDRGFTIKEIADYLHMKPNTVGHIFTGYSLPDDDTVRKLCELFDVDEAFGSGQFQAAHRKYDTKGHKTTYKAEHEPAPADEAHIQEQLAAARAFNERVAARNQPEPKQNPDIFEMVYGVLSYEEFNAFFDAVAGKEGDPLALVYGKVSFSAYKKIAEIVKEV